MSMNGSLVRGVLTGVASHRVEEGEVRAEPCSQERGKKAAT